jgi:hypothetical protein
MVKDQNFTNFVKELQDVFNISQEEPLSDEEKNAFYEKHRAGKTDQQIIELMNPNKLKMSATEQKEAIDNYFMSNQQVAEDVKKAEVLKWLQKNIATTKLNPESLKYGIDSITMLKTREELKQTMLKIEELRLKYGIDYIDSRTSDSLIKMEDALGNVDYKDVFNRWADLESFTPGIDNFTYLLTAAGIENFTFKLDQSLDEEDDIEFEGDDITSLDEWKIKKTYDANGVAVLNGDGSFNIISEGGQEDTLTRE